MDVLKSVQASKLPENKNLKIVVAIVLVVLVVGAGAYFYLLGTPGRLGTQKDLPEFIIEDPTFVLADGEVSMSPSDIDNFLLGRALMRGRIEELPVVNGATGETEVLTSFRRTDGGSVLANLVLGPPDRQIGELIAHGGLVGFEQEWGFMTVSEASTLLRKNDPMFIYLEVDDVSREFFEDETCTDICQDILQEIKDNFENNSRLVSAVRGETNIPMDTLTVGSIFQIVIYGE